MKFDAEPRLYVTSISSGTNMISVDKNAQAGIEQLSAPQGSLASLENGCWSDPCCCFTVVKRFMVAEHSTINIRHACRYRAQGHHFGTLCTNVQEKLLGLGVSDNGDTRTATCAILSMTRCSLQRRRTKGWIAHLEALRELKRIRLQELSRMPMRTPY